MSVVTAAGRVAMSLVGAAIGLAFAVITIPLIAITAVFELPRKILESREDKP